jgi:NADP-dependent 3-hydroxy acid dehydrogenase YdfG
MNGTMAGKRAIIVGASSGIGRAIARSFAGEGADVVMVARDKDKLRRASEELEPLGVNSSYIVTDVLDPEAVDALIITAAERMGGIDILVYATGTNTPDRALRALKLEDWHLLLDTNLTGAFYCTKAVLPIMRGQRDGLIIYISSRCVQRPDASGVSYQASKHGLVGLAHGAMEEERAEGIRTTVIYPGLTDTPLLLKRPTPTPRETLENALKPEDVARACLFVAALPSRAHVPELILLPSKL